MKRILNKQKNKLFIREGWSISLLILVSFLFFTNIGTLEAQVLISNSADTPDSTAMLEVKSTNKGFLPPRMTAIQRDAINNPTAGLIIYCTDCLEMQMYNDTAWTNMIGGAVSTPPMPIAIGDFYEGGVVFYLDGAGGGIVCAISDQSAAATWGCNGTEISGADGTAIGTGAQNTIDIVAGCTTPGIAAHFCDTLSLNGYNDWFLPSIDELHEVFLNNAVINSTAIANGGSAFAYAYYWSSSEGGSISAWLQYLQPGSGVQTLSNKTDPTRVRAVRAF